MIEKLEYFNEEWEEIIDYYYSSKKKVAFDNLFVDSVKSLIDNDISISDFKVTNYEIPQEELERFFRDSNITDTHIINCKNFEEDWSLITSLLETENYFIMRVWSTTA